MSAFHRMVTYLHLYDHNTKGRNIGFAKIEKQNGKCRIEIHMKNTGYSISPIPVYFYTQKQQNFNGIPLGNMQLARGNGDFKAVITEKDWANHGYSLEDVKGIFIPVSEETMFVSQWDNDPFVREKFIAPPLPQNASSNGGTHQPPSETQPNPQKLPETEAPLQPNTSSGPQTPPAAQKTGETNTPDTIPNDTQTKDNTRQNKNPTPADTTPETSQNPANALQNETLQPADIPQNDNSRPVNATQNQALQPADIPQNENPHPVNATQNQALQPADIPQNDNSRPVNATQNQALQPADSPQNSLKATEASPRRRQAVYRNPFALPRFPLWQQDFRQRQPFPGRASSSSSPTNIQKLPSQNNLTEDSGKTKQEPPDTPAEDWNMKWQFLLENYPVMTPFAGDEDTLCIRLDLKDLRLLPQKYWYLGNNSFLLHGFFNYRYLILGMTEKSGCKKWFLGIPGVFQNPERVMATLFGFPGFRNEKSSPINTGEFGYWYRYLDE